MNTNHSRSTQRGFSLIEVLVAVVILAVGLLALAALQVNLTRGSAEAKAQSVALGLAQEELEALRGFVSRNAFATDICGGDDADRVIDMVGAGATFDLSVAVERYLFNEVTGNFQLVPADDVCSGAVGGGMPEFKRVTVAVVWMDATGQAREVRLTDILSSVSPSDSGLSLQPPKQPRLGPQVRIFTPDEAGVIPIAIGDDLAAASSNPRPELSQRGSTTTTQFNVQTYLTDASNPLLQRRIDFAYINCNCRLAGMSNQNNPSFEPTFWNGERYMPPRRRPALDAPADASGKRIGISTTDLQNQERFEAALCTSCCRDHHDDLDAEVLFDPFRAATDYASTGGNHHHYRVSGSSLMFALATDQSPEYRDICRLVRVDGIFRVAVDTRLENVVVLRAEDSPVGALLPEASVDTYAEFAKTFVEEAWAGYFPVNYPEVDSNPAVSARCLPAASDPLPPSACPEIGPDTVYFPDMVRAGCSEDADSGVVTCDSSSLAMRFDTNLTDNTPFLDVPGTQHVTMDSNCDAYHLQSRGIYIDYISPDAQQALACIGDQTPACRRFRERETLELVPFVAVNLTGLSDWTSSNGDVVTVQSQGINNRGYERGRVNAVGEGEGRIFASAYGANAGLVNRNPTDPFDFQRRIQWREDFRVRAGVAAPRFSIQVATSPTNLANFDERQQADAQVVSPPICPSVCQRQGGGDRDKQNCYMDAATVTLQVRFYSYNVEVCQGGGANQTCSVRNFQLCGMSMLPTDVTAVVQPPVNSGQENETTDVVFASSASGQSLSDQLAGRTVRALFAAEGTCPVL